MPKLLKRIVPIAILIAVVLGWKTYNKNKASAAVREQAVELVRAFPLYEENQEYYDSAFDELHEVAFDQSCKMGGRRTSARFDDKQYLAFLIGMFHSKAVADRRMEFAESLTSYRKILDLPFVDFGDGAASQ